MKNDEAVSPVIWIFPMVVITVILAAVIMFVPSMAGNVQKTADCCNGCEQTKTSTIDTYIGPAGVINIRDSDGCEYSFSGWRWDYDKYRGHNVTFSYNPYSKVNGYTEITGVIHDYGPVCCNTNCAYQCGGCTPCCVTPVPTPECGCR